MNRMKNDLPFGSESFTAYEIRHDDLSVAIAEDDLASFYRIGGEFILDHSPQVLSLRPADDAQD